MSPPPGETMTAREIVDRFLRRYSGNVIAQPGYADMERDLLSALTAAQSVARAEGVAAERERAAKQLLNLASVAHGKANHTTSIAESEIQQQIKVALREAAAAIRTPAPQAEETGE